MTANFLWGGVGSVYNLLTTELNSLADGSGSAYGPQIDNSSNAYQEGQLELSLASNSLAFTINSYVDVFLVPSIDAAGSTYPTYTPGGSYKLAESNYRAGRININPATQSSNAVVEIVQGVRIPPGKWKTILVNHCGVTLPSSGNTLNLTPTPSQY